MASGSKTTLKDFRTGDLARVVEGRLLVSGTGGGVGTNVNIDAVGGNPVGTTVPISGTVTVNQPVVVNQGTSPWVVGGTVTANQGTSPWVVGGTVAVSGTVAVTQSTSPWVVSGTVTANQGTAGLSPWPVTVNGTVDAIVAIRNLPSTRVLTLYQTNDTFTTATDAGPNLYLPSISVPKINVFEVADGAPYLPLHTDEAANLCVAGWIRGRVQGSETPVWDIVPDSADHSSAPFNQANGGCIAAICVADPNDDLRTDDTWGTLRLDLNQRLIVNGHVKKRTYRAATVTFVQTAASNAMFFVIAGSNTQTIRIQRVRASGMTTVSGEYGEIVAELRSSAPSGGTATTLVQVPLDSANAAPTASLCQVYTAAPTEGTLVGTIGCLRNMWQPITVNISSPLMAIFEWDFRNVGENQEVVLRGDTETFNLAYGTTPSSATLVSVEIEWTEEDP